MIQSHTEIATTHASRYLQQLCKHFAHKLPVTFGPSAGKIDFPMGDCELSTGDDRLRLELASDDEARLAKLKEVVIRHLERFAFRENLAVAWQAS